MRIPVESLTYYLGDNEHKSFAENARAGVIDASAGMRSTLSHSAPETPRANKPGKKAAHNSRLLQDPVSYGERRQQERRKSHQAVVLDTRLKERRRELRLHASVNFEI